MNFEDDRLSGLDINDMDTILECHMENAKMLSKEMMTTLGGRYIPIEVYPFSFIEYLRWAAIPFDDQSLLSTGARVKLKQAYKEYFKWGGLPESLCLPVKRNYISSVYQKIRHYIRHKQKIMTIYLYLLRIISLRLFS